jgi:hypothetical protein
MQTVTMGEVALFVVGVVGTIVGVAALRDATRRHAWIRWSGNERARRISRRRVRMLATRLGGCVVAAVVGGIAAMSPGWFYRGAGVAMAFGLGLSVAAGIMDAVEGRTERSPDIRAELDADGFDDYAMPIR